MTFAALPRMIALVAAAVWLALPAFAAAAQPATPAASTATATACTTTPRSDADLASLGATPAASVTPVAGMPAGGEIDEATFAAIQATLDQVSACQAAGKVNAVLARYTNDYVTNVALAPETVPIVQGTPAPSNATPAATPAAQTPPAPVMIAARSGPGEAVSGVVLDGTGAHLFVFKQENGMWKIDGVGDLPPAPATPEAEQPAPIRAALADAAAKANAPASGFAVLYAEPREWPDTALGCPEPGRVYAQVVTAGWLVLIAGPDAALEYHTDATTHVVLCRTVSR